MTSTAAQETTNELPASAISRDGILWRPNQDIWELGTIHSNNKINFHSIKELVSESLFTNIKMAFVCFCETHSSIHAINSANRLFFFIKKIHTNNKLDKITIESILIFRSGLISRNEHYLGGLRSFLLYWSKTEIPGIDKSTISILESLRLKGNNKGEAVLTRDPEFGPFSRTEFASIISGIHYGLQDGTIQLEEFLLVWLFSAFGSRPIQMAALKCRDFSKNNNGESIPDFFLRIPRAKQRFQSLRSEFTTRKIPANIARSFEILIKQIRVDYKYSKLPGSDLPLFPTHRKSTNDFHHTSNEILYKLQRTLSRINIVSERTGKPLKISALRFRYTLGTRAAAEGAGELVIAELLDHSDTQNAGVYVQATPEMVDRIDLALAIQIGPMVKSFQGSIVDGTSVIKNGTKLSSVISDKQNKRNPVGNCACNSHCHVLAPVACYTCRSFHPWIDGPHLDVLNDLLEHRESVLSLTGDVTMASIRDTTIYACAEVVKLCSDKKSSLEIRK